MTVKKLSDSNKQEILELYRQTPETTSTLAERYGVSNSTISRLLKATLPEDEYETLIAAKRAARTPHSEAVQMQLLSEPEIAGTQPLVEPEPSPETLEIAEEESTSVPRKRRRTSATSKPEEVPAVAEVHPEIAQTPSVEVNNSPLLLNQGVDSQPESLESPTPVVSSSTPEPLDEDSKAEATAIAAEILGEELLDESEDIDDDDIDDEDDLEDFDDEEDLEEETPVIKRRLPVRALVQVLPLSQATLPKTCYLVIDRAAELITRPLKDFGELGQIPSQEILQRTLPVFDNHRVARRFSNKRERVIKVPDSRILQKARPHLQAKGITRLLVDGQVYSLLSN